MVQVLVVVEDGVIKDVVSENKDMIVHVVNRGRVEIDKETSVVISKADSAEVSTSVDHGFDFRDYVKSTYGINLENVVIH